MAAKYQLMTELYRRTGIAVAKNPQAWQSFLAAACRNYKCRFDEQLLIYAQRPDAIAVAELDIWNKRFKRWVNKDSKGIAVFDPKGRRNTLKYYFDVSDTHDGYYGSRPVPIWQMNGRYEQAVIERLSDRFGNTESTDLASALTETAKNAVEDNLQDYFSQLKGFTQDSFLEELDDLNVEVCYRRLVTNSVAFMLISRSNAWKFSEELRELYPLRYLYKEGDVVYIGADKYEITDFDENAVSLRNAEFPLFGKEYSREDFEEKLKENPANDHLKVVVTEKERTEAPSEKKPDGIQFSIGFSEHPAFYDRQLNDRYTDFSFALGNKLLGVLDEKQHRERESKEIGWYHKTDFEITATVGGEDFHYEGRFDIGDGEGDLIAHIKNYYGYCLSPQCPFIPEWKRQGEDYYRERMDSLRLGRDVFVPFLEQNTELTPEDEKLLAEIMATESDWYRKAEEPERPSAADEMIAYAEKVASEYESEPQEERLEILMTSDAFPDPEDVYAIWDNIREKYYADDYGKILTYPTEKAANEGLAAVKKAVADKETEEWLYVERAKQGLDPVPTQDNADPIGKEITIDNRKYVVESVGRISGDVSLRDITFQNSTGFPINRVEKIGYIRSLLEQAEAELPSEEKTDAPAALSADRHNFRITNDTLGVGGAKEKFRNNMAAINLLHELEIENRLATPEEQEILSRYVGWDGLSMAFDEHNAAWADEFKELYATLSPEEYNAAMESTLTAFYTPPVVIKAMY